MAMMSLDFVNNMSERSLLSFSPEGLVFYIHRVLRLTDINIFTFKRLRPFEPPLLHHKKILQILFNDLGLMIIGSFDKVEMCPYADELSLV